MTTAADEQEDLQAAAARIRAMSSAEVDAASDADVARMMKIVDAARRQVEEREAAAQQVEEDRRRLREELLLSADAEFVAGVRSAAAAGAPSTRRTAAEYGSWSDGRIAMLRLDPEEQLAVQTGIPLDQLGITVPIPDWVIEADEEPDEPSPLLIAYERLALVQAEANRAESARVRAALTAWRTADALSTGRPDGAVNGPYFRGALMQIAIELQIAERTAATMIHTADDLDRLLPRTWRRFALGEVPWRAMQQVHAVIEDMDPDVLPAFDEAASTHVVETPLPRLKDKLRKLAERLQPDTAVDRHAKAKEQQRVEVEPASDGMIWIHALIEAPEGVHIDACLDLAARQSAAEPGETRSVAQLRAEIFKDVFAEWLGQDASTDEDNVLVPQRRGVQCKVGLLIPAMTAMGHSDVPAQLEGYGPIDIETAKRLAGDATSWIKVLTDPITGAVWDIGRDKYRPTSDMRVLLGLLDGGSRGPGRWRPPRKCEADHVEPFWQHFARGRTALDNLVLLARNEHVVKTSGIYEIELRANRDLAWTSIAGTRIITKVEPLEPTPVPEEFLHPPAPPAPTEWADPDEPDDLNCPF